MATKKIRFIIIDANALIYRAFHALPPLTTADGRMVNAVYGFTAVLLKVLKEFKPEYIAVAYDVAGKTFRHEAYKEYKATRVKAAQELYDQIPITKEVLKILGIRVYEQAGYEADDVIGTLTIREEIDRPNVESIVVTGDMDALQLVDANTKVYKVQKGVTDTLLYDENLVREKIGLAPNQIVDYKALAGDTSDNIPGVKGVGPKTAVTLLREYGTLENIYAALKKNPVLKNVTPRISSLLIAHEKEARLSQDLARIDVRAPIKFALEDCRQTGYDREAAVALFRALEFKSLIQKLPDAQVQGAFDLGSAPQPKQRTRTKTYHLVDTLAELKTVLTNAADQKLVAVDTETNGLDPLTSDLLGVSLSWQTGEAYYLDVRPDKKDRAEWLALVKEFLENPAVGKCGHNMKFDQLVLRSAGINLQPLVFDTMIASYLLNPSNRQHNLDTVVFNEFGHEKIPLEELIGKRGKNQISVADVPVEDMAEYSCEDADYTFRLVAPLGQRLRDNAQQKLFETIEMPLVTILSDLEQHGVLINTTFLGRMQKQIGRRIQVLEKSIYKQAGEEFNINSPQQMKRIFFDKLDLDTEGIGVTKTGYSTAASELEKLQDAHPIVPLIIEYRELAKLQSTYIEALPELINPATGRVHTSFNQTVTTTGRLSSSNPNFQNIPIRTELGREIRKAFIAPPGSVIVSADYSQIELRIVASLANDKNMIEAFQNGEDIHARTAAEIHGCDIDTVSKDMRRAAKAINFGIIYGMGTYGLARSTDLDLDEARDYIEAYFDHHEGIREYIEQTKALARKLGYVETLFGRRRYLPEIKSGMPQVRAAAERMAVNMPVQGTAADLMKLAMIEVSRKLQSLSPKTKMILQVHDELVFEVPKAELKKVSACIHEVMEGIYKIRVPINVEVEAGPNWGELTLIKE